MTASGDDLTVNVRVTSPRAAAWREYLDAEIDPTANDRTLSGDTVTCTYDAERVSVVLVDVDVSFE